MAHKAGPTRVEAAVGEQDVHTVGQDLGLPKPTEQEAKHTFIRRVMPGKVLPEVGAPPATQPVALRPTMH